MLLSEFSTKLRLKICRLANRLILGHVAGSLPAHFLSSIEEFFSHSAVQKHLVSTQTLLPPHLQSWNFPATYPASFRREFHFKKKNIFLLKNVIVGPLTGTVWTPDGYVFGESIGSLNKALSFGKARLDLMQKPRKKTELSTPVFPVSCASFFHWLLEGLPNLLHVLKEYPEARLLVYPKRPRYMDQSLELLLGASWHERVLKSITPLHVSSAVFATVPDASGFVSSSDIQIVRKAMLRAIKSACNQDSEFKPKKIYISRTLRKIRHLPNELQIESDFKEQGYRIIHSEKLCFQDQIHLFASATHIAGPHGAGLSNLIFAPEGVKVTEIFPPDYFNDCYARISNTINQIYSYL